MAMVASLSSFGGQNVMLMRQNDMSRSESMLAMLTSCNPHVGFQVPRSGGGLEDAIVGVKRPYYPTFEHTPAQEEPHEDGDEVDDDQAGRVEKKRRLSFDQVRSLERNFEVENKLEPERKMQLAKELGLQPRQVAVWFQNRRARWKTKQLERDYEILNSGYLKLKADFETALREKDVLKAEVLRLSGKAISTSHDSHAVDSSQCGSETTSSEKDHLETSTDPHETRPDSNSPSKVVDPKDASTSSGSNSSELLDADSPRANYEDHSAASQLPPESFVGPMCNLLEHVDASSADSSQPASFSVKLEDGFHVDIPSCNYFLPQIGGEQSVLPWWDWP